MQSDEDEDIRGLHETITLELNKGSNPCEKRQTNKRLIKMKYWI